MERNIVAWRRTALALTASGALLVSGAVASAAGAHHTHYRPANHIGHVLRGVEGTAYGQVVALESTGFLLQLAGGNLLAVNVPAGTDEAAYGGVQGTSLAVQDYAFVRYRFTANGGVIGQNVLFSTSAFPAPNGDVDRALGQITAVGNGQFTLTLRHGQSLTLNVLPDTVIQLDGTTTTAASLAVGDFASAWFQSGNGTDNALRVVLHQHPVQTHPAQVSGTLQAVSGNDLTVTTANSQTVTVVVSSSTRIWVNGTLTDLASVVVGSNLTVHAVGREFGSTLYARSVSITG